MLALSDLLPFSYGFLKILTETKFIYDSTHIINIRYRNFVGTEKPQRRKKKSQSHSSEITTVYDLMSLFLRFRGLKITLFSLPKWDPSAHSVL